MDRICFIAAMLSCSLAVPFLSAHDDGKGRDAQAPYSGPGFRAAVDQTVPLAFHAQAVQLRSWIPLGEFGESIVSANDCWGYVSGSGREYALIGLSHGTGFAEITDPDDVKVIDVVTGPVSGWRDIKVYGDYAYVVSEGGGGVQIIDLSQIDAGTVSLVRSFSSPGVVQTHNVAINETSGFLYRCGGAANGLRIYDLSDPVEPAYVGSWSDRYVHDAQAVTYQEGPYAGREIAFCAAGLDFGETNTGLSIVDVTDKQNIVTLAHYEYPGSSYAHQGWLSPDRHYFYLNDESDEFERQIPSTTHVIDVSNLTEPVEAVTFTNGSMAVDHNLYTRDNLIFEANYRNGLRVFDASNPLAPVEIGFYDTYPEDDEARFNGLWSNYPFFPSGIVIGSDIEKGLFVWRIETRPLNAEAQTRLLFPWVSNSDTFESTIHVSNHGPTQATIVLTARRENGDSEQTTEHLIPARGFLEIKAADFFRVLGKGAGYAVLLESESQTLSGRWVTNDRTQFSPSQGLAVALPTDGETHQNVAATVVLGAMPGNETLFSAPVIVNTGAAPADITLYYFDKNGGLVITDRLESVQPFSPATPRIIDAATGNLYAVAVCETANITGAVFVFNNQGQSSIANTTSITNFVIP